MKKRELETLLNESGFKFVRPTKQGEMYSDGVSVVVMPRSMPGGGHNAANVLADIKRAVRARESIKPPIVPTTLTTKLGDSFPSKEIPVKVVPKEVPIIPTPARSHRDPSLLREMRLFVRDRWLAGETVGDIVTAATKEGYTRPNGSPADPAFISTDLHRLAVQKEIQLLNGSTAVNPYKKAPAIPQEHPIGQLFDQWAGRPPVTPAPAPVVTAGHVAKKPLLSIITDPDLTDAKKLKLVAAYLED